MGHEPDVVCGTNADRDGVAGNAITWDGGNELAPVIFVPFALVLRIWVRPLCRVGRRLERAPPSFQWERTQKESKKS